MLYNGRKIVVVVVVVVVVVLGVLGVLGVSGNHNSYVQGRCSDGLGITTGENAVSSHLHFAVLFYLGFVAR